MSYWIGMERYDRHAITNIIVKIITRKVTKEIDNQTCHRYVFPVQLYLLW